MRPQNPASTPYGCGLKRALSMIGCALTLCLLSGAVLAWTTVGNGIEYQAFTTSDPNNLFVCRMDRNNTAVTLETTIANGKLAGYNREIIRNQATRYDEAINWWGQSWGQRNDVVCAINGDLLNTTTGQIASGTCHSGWYAKRMPDWGGWSAFAWNVNRVPFIGNCTHDKPADYFVKYMSSGATQNLQGTNIARTASSLIIYTPQYDDKTPAQTTGVEVLVEMTRPTLIIKSSNYTSGIVRQVWQNSGSHYIPFDHIVLSAGSSVSSTLLNNATVGSEVRISQFPTDYNEPDVQGNNGCATATGIDWQKTYAAIGINYRFLENGVVRIPDAVAHPGYAGLVDHSVPRTVIAYNATYIYFVVCDGRGSGGSRGMSMEDIGNWCVANLGATEGVNIDGGGSSTMVVNGVLKNVPSDGSERAVANGISMINLLPKTQTTAFAAGQPVKVNTASTNVRLGPGTNYGVLATLAVNTQGTIVSHSLNGVLAKGYNWWKVDFSGTVGWVAQTLLTAVTATPTITQHPSAAAVCAGGTATFTAAATGSPTPTYLWQKNGVDLTNAGHYSNVTTDALTISPCDATDAADYRCVATNTYGSTPTNAAALTVNQPPSIAIGSPSRTVTRNTSVDYPVTYANADSVTLTGSHITLNKTGTAAAGYTISGSGNASRTVSLISISGDGTIGISIAAGSATNSACGSAPAAGPSATVLVDNTAPSAVTVADEGTWTPSLTTLKANWTASSDGGGSGVDRYEYSIGTAANAQDVKAWTPVGDSTTVIDSSLSLTDSQTYYIQARAVDKAGNTGTGSAADGITVAPPAAAISSAWSLANEVGLSLRGKRVTAARGGSFWLEELDRTAAIRVVSGSPVSAGNTVSVAGVLGIDGTERVLIGDVVENSGGSSTLPMPLGMIQRGLGGASFNAATPGVTGGESIYNVGMLVRCCGTVTYVDTTDPADKYFYFDDGSGVDNGASHAGVLVRCGSVTPPASGVVVVTGVISTELWGGRVVPVLMLRSAADLMPL